MLALSNCFSEAKARMFFNKMLFFSHRPGCHLFVSCDFNACNQMVFQCFRIGNYQQQAAIDYGP